VMVSRGPVERRQPMKPLASQNMPAQTRLRSRTRW
jgi:hypothetical protein